MADAPPDDFSDHEAVEAWLKTQPQAVSVALAARAALRSVPTFSRLDWYRSPREAAVLLCQSLCAAAASSFCSCGYQRVAARRAARAAYVAASGYASVAAAAAERHIIPIVGPAARIAADAANAAITDDDHAGSAIVSRFDAAAGSAVAWADGARVARYAARADALLLAGGDPAAIRAVCASPLWPDGPPDWAEAAWSKLKAALPRDEGWAVWTDWYEARLRGAPYDLALEEARVLEPAEEDWKDPKRANVKLAEIEARFRAKAVEALTQDGRGGQFIEREGRLVLAESAGATAPDADVKRRPTVSALRRLAESLARTNQHGDLREIADRLVALLDRPPTEAAPDAYEIWALSLQLAEYRARDDAARKDPGGFDEPLDPARRFALDASVPAVAVYARSFEAVRDYDDQLAAFEGAVASPAAQRVVIQTAVDTEVLARESGSVVLHLVAAGKGSDAIAERARKGGWFTTRNLIAASALVASTVGAGYLGEVGASAAQSHDLYGRVERLFVRAPDAIDEIMRAAPSDLRHAVDAVRATLGAKPPAAPPPRPSKGAPH